MIGNASGRLERCCSAAYDSIKLAVVETPPLHGTQRDVASYMYSTSLLANRGGIRLESESSCPPPRRSFADLRPWESHAFTEGPLYMVALSFDTLDPHQTMHESAALPNMPLDQKKPLRQTVARWLPHSTALPSLTRHWWVGNTNLQHIIWGF